MQDILNGEKLTKCSRNDANNDHKFINNTSNGRSFEFDVKLNYLDLYATILLIVFFVVVFFFSVRKYALYIFSIKSFIGSIGFVSLVTTE